MIYVKSKSKDIIVEDASLQKVVEDTLARMAAVAGRTMGPGGRPVLIEREGMPPLVTKDGVTVIKALGLPSAGQNIVLDACKEISLNTARDAGDGTTTAIVLGNALYRYGKAFMEQNPKYNPQRFSRELKSCYDEVILPYLKDKAIKVQSEEDLERVALISANGDKEVAQCVVKAFMSAGDDGTVLIQEDQGGGMRVETIDGYIVTTGLKDIGSIGPAFMNDRAGQQVRMDQGLIVLFDGVISDLTLPIAIQTAIDGSLDLTGKPIIIMAHGFCDLAVERCLRTSKGGVSVIPVKIPKSGLANSRSMFLHDIAALTGASIVDPSSIVAFDESRFGRFIHAKVNTYETFIQAESDANSLDNRVSELKSILESARSEHDKAHIRASIGKLTGGISTIMVGGMTDAEIRERRDRVQDAVEAVRSAVAEGIVPGGCATHIAIAEVINSLIEKQDRPLSWNVMLKSLLQPFDLLMENCGENDIAASACRHIVETMDDDFRPTVVFDADQHKMVDPWKAGIVEPAKVHRVAIGNALSVASLFVTLGGIVVSPRDYNMETQMELSKLALKDMMSQANEDDV